VELHEAVRELQSLGRRLIQLKRMKSIRDFLKIVIIGFFFGRRVEEEISKTEKKHESLLRNIDLMVSEHLDSLKRQIEKIENSDVQLSKNDEEQWLNLLKSFETDLNYLKSQRALDETYCSAALDEIARFRHFIAEYNSKLEKRRLTQKLLKLRSDVLQAEKEFNSLYDSEYYFSQADLHSWKERWSALIQTLEGCVGKENLDIDFKDSISRIVDVFQKGEQIVRTRNIEFIEEEILRFKDLFDNIESYPLTENQRKAIVVDEKSNLIVAGAGTGKTSTIIGKVGYIVKKGLAVPEDILLIAFNRDVVSEMDERVHSCLGIRLNVRTYHSLGLSIIAESEGAKPSVSELAADRIKLPKKILEFLQGEMEDPKLSELVNRYLIFHLSPYRTAFDFKSFGEYIEYLKKYEIRSLKGDVAKSFEECDIANFLYINGINYEYEKPYEINTADVRHRQYKPDFFLPDYGIYIEHFGIDRAGNTAPYIPRREYNEEIRWKRDVHEKNKTTLVETYSYERQEGKILSNLEEKLRQKGVVFNPIQNKQLFDELNKLGKVNTLALLLSTFLNLYKSCGKTLDEIRNNVDHEDKRTLIFLDIFSRTYNDYTSYLEEIGEVDFNDMINKATNLVRQGKYLSRFKYILVDEFQDISQSRYRFLKSLLDQYDSKLFCVGDDWQSIYRFTGSDLSIMLDFQEHFDFCERNCLEQTFRFSDKLCEFSTKFILQNPNQIKKSITSHKKENEPAVTLIKGEMKNVLGSILSSINQRDGERKTVFIIGRYNYLEPENLYQIAKMYPKLTIEFSTAHSSKGLEADYVIIVGLTSGEYGFPCQIMDDPILNLVLAKRDSFPNAEERRLFYVSMTRAKKHVYLVVDDYYSVSSFVSEIQQEGYEIEIVGRFQRTLNCPICKTGWIVLRSGQYGEFYSCSNYPYCEYRPKRCPKCQKGFLYKKELKYHCSDSSCSFEANSCPFCNDGYLVLKKGKHGHFYGCSNYPKCSYIQREHQRKPRYRDYIS